MLQRLMYIVFVGIFSIQTFAVDGIAVSVAFTLKRERSYGGWRGDILRIDIENSRPVRYDTLYHGIAHCPTISPDGKYVAFFRDGDTWDKATQTRTRGGADHLSVMTIDGKELRDLITFDGDLASNQAWRNGEDRLMSWPVGGWIYYNQPHHTATIMRVNVADPSQQEKMHNYNSADGFDEPLRRWNLSVEGHVACGDALFRNAPHTFPDIKVAKCYAGCNGAISCSGRFRSAWGRNASEEVVKAHPGYTMSGHSLFTFADFNKTTLACSGGFGLQPEDYVSLRHVAEWLGRDSVGRGMELIYWAVNSDKWSMYTCGWESWGSRVTRQGCNQLLFNWIDFEAILATDNPYNPTASAATWDISQSYCATAGAFWVRPPKEEYIGTHYEDISGQWLPYTTQSTTPVESVRNSWDLSGPKAVLKRDPTENRVHSKIRHQHQPQPWALQQKTNSLSVRFPDGSTAWNIRIVDMKGRRAYEAKISGASARIPVHHLRGVYILSITGENPQCRLMEKCLRF
jgi:hypothetical protein